MVTTARFVLCQHFTNCSRQSYATDFTEDSTKRNLKTREGFRRYYQTLDHLATYRLLEQNCREWSIKNVGRDTGLNEGIRLKKSAVFLESA